MDGRLISFCIVALVAMLVIRQWKSDLVPIMRMAIALGFALLTVTMLSPLVAYLKRLTDTAIAPEQAQILLKALGLAVLTQYAADICKECGENALANGVELIGKVEILLLSLPLIDRILELAGKLLSLGNG